MRVRYLISTVTLLAACAAPAHARTAPNPDGHAGPVLLREWRSTSSAAGESAPTHAATPTHRETPSAVQSVPVPLPAGAVQIDSTYYDLQDLGSLGTRIVLTPDGKVHATWEDDFCELDPAGCPPNPNAPIPFPQRAMAYAYRSPAGVWTRVGRVGDSSLHCSQCVPDELGGFGTLAVLGDGRAAIAQHLNEDGCDLRGDFYLENAVAGSSWKGYLTPIVSPSYLFPQIAALPNGSFTLLGEVPRVISSCTHCGVNDFRISRVAAAGQTFTCPTGWQMGPWTQVVNMTTFRGGYSGFPCLASASDGRVGIAVTEFGGNAWLIESRDGTFATGTITIRNLIGYSDAQITSPDSTSSQWRPYIHCQLAYNDTTPNVVWSELQARKSGSTVFYVDWRSRIRHWSSERGVSTVKQVAAGEADGYDNVDLGLSGPLAGFNTLSVDWPEIGFSPDGFETYVVWARFTDAEVDPTADEGLTGICTGTGYGDIVASVTHSGQGWSSPQNLTLTPKTDERYPGIAPRNPGGVVHLLFQASATDQAGVVQAQDRGTTGPLLVRRIGYLERRLDASVVGVDETPRADATLLRSWPNPSHGGVRFALGGPGPATGAVLIYAVTGQLVARVPVSRGSEAGWDGYDRLGRPSPTGIYLARLEGSPAPAGAAKFLLLH